MSAVVCGMACQHSWRTHASSVLSSIRPSPERHGQASVKREMLRDARTMADLSWLGVRCCFAAVVD